MSLCEIIVYLFWGKYCNFIDIEATGKVNSFEHGTNKFQTND